MKRRDEVTVGILITIAVAVLVLGTLWLARGGLKSGYPLYTQFGWGQNLKQGQPVLLAGVTVGNVADVNLRRQGFLDVMLRIDDKYQIPKGSTATVKAVGIFGDVAVALTPPVPVPTVSYASGDTVPPGPVSADIDLILSRTDSIARTTSVLLTALQQQVIAAGTLKDIHKLVADLAAASGQLQGVVREQNKNFTETMAAFKSGATHLSNAVDSARIAASLENVRVTSDNFSRLVANVDSTNTRLSKLLDQANNPNGTLGRFLTDSMLYTDGRRTLASLDSVLADFKANPRKYINLSIFGRK
jgi:phospholipid/cholesterol/gamma-HCH transport system substrate-binding protein